MNNCGNTLFTFLNREVNFYFSNILPVQKPRRGGYVRTASAYSLTDISCQQNSNMTSDLESGLDINFFVHQPLWLVVSEVNSHTAFSLATMLLLGNECD